MERIVLIDQAEDGYCEDRGWVSVDVSEDEARDVLANFCFDTDGNGPARPVGEARRVWLKPDPESSPYPDEQRWHPCPEGEGREFYEFDATDTEALPRTA